MSIFSFNTIVNNTINIIILKSMYIIDSPNDICMGFTIDSPKLNIQKVYNVL